MQLNCLRVAYETLLHITYTVTEATLLLLLLLVYRCFCCDCHHLLLLPCCPRFLCISALRAAGIPAQLPQCHGYWWQL